MDNATANEEIRSHSDPKRIYAKKGERLTVDLYGHSHDGQALFLCTNQSGTRFITKEENLKYAKQS